MSLRHTIGYSDYRGHTLVTAPDIEPVTLEDVKDQLELDATDTGKDNQIELFIQAAREQVEQFTGLALITQTWKLVLDRWPMNKEPWWDGVRQGAISDLYSRGRATNVLLPRYPLQSVSGITADDTAVTVADTFIVDVNQKPGRLVLKSNASWPVILQQANGIEITYVSGFGNNASDVPAAIRLGIAQMAAYMFEHRGDCNTEDAFNMSGARRLVDAYAIRGL